MPAYQSCSSFLYSSSVCPTCAEFQYVLTLDIPPLIFVLIGMANQLCKLQRGIPQVVAEQLAFVFPYRIGSGELYAAESRILVLYDTVRRAVRVRQVVCEEEAWCRGEDVLWLVILVWSDDSDQGAQRSLDGHGGHQERAVRLSGNAWAILERGNLSAQSQTVQQRRHRHHRSLIAVWSISI